MSKYAIDSPALRHTRNVPNLLTPQERNAPSGVCRWGEDGKEPGEKGVVGHEEEKQGKEGEETRRIRCSVSF